ncbi:MAG: hypothetical protein OEY20_02995 [Gemmatimonadota bacterium]|nr:hypothetical protein [Gemmatimonadota bacterium]MDH5196203.1 hypothetical protein [Gemmatimonadota bacterium]
MRRHLMLLGLAFAVGFLAGCQEEAKPLLGPENALEVVNAQDTFSLRIDDLKNVYTELAYTWDNSQARARVFHCSFLPHGQSRLLLIDAAGDTVYDRKLLYRLEGISFVDGAPGAWTVFIGFYGSLGAWADFALDATSDTAISGVSVPDICVARGR